MKRVARLSLYLSAGLAGVVLLLLAAVYIGWRMSLPQLTGAAPLPQLKQPVIVTRDAQGTAVFMSQTLPDTMRALGYVHAQERFFEMDLTRRSAAGELSELFGKATLKMDQEKRPHRLRARLAANLALAGDADRQLIGAYTEGVNAGLNALSAQPWQYTILQTKPVPWREVDSLLVVAEMYSTLQLRSLERAFENAALRERVGDAVFAWLRPAGGRWDAALDNSTFEPMTLPTAAMINTRAATKVASTRIFQASTADEAETLSTIGSNNWAVGGALSAHGGGILADDMHLGLGVPNIWFRAQFELNTAQGSRRIAGVSLPGVPAMVAGSNGDIAWGFTNTEGRWFDWVKVSADEPVVEQREEIRIAGAPPETLIVKETRFGPIARTWNKQAYALAWTAYLPGAINTHLTDLMFAKSVDEALPIAQQSGMPHQNILLVDKKGNAAWTVAGRMPARFAGESPQWTGFTPAQSLPRKWLDIADYPVVKNPADARLWTANNRQMGGAAGARISEGGFDLGARAQQIRDRLREQKQFDEKALYAIQLDREGRFMKHWAEFLQGAAEKNGSADAVEMARLIKAWNGRADVDQAAYRIARAFRVRIQDELWRAWIASVAPDLGFAINWDGRMEYPAWQALNERPMHLLPKPFDTWDAFINAQIDALAKELKDANGSLEQATWGKRNTARIIHPFSRALPALGFLLDMPATPLPGDNHMPMVLSSNAGASERMVVAPGHEENGILTMPGGQSGHPLSPFYGAGHSDWLEGKPAPLLAGEAKYILRLTP